MHVKPSLHKILDSAIHKSRIKSLNPIIEAIVNSKQLNLTQLGRALDTGVEERAGIRRVDRLLANKYYQEKSGLIYEQITRFAIGTKTCPVILVDWSSLPNSLHMSEEGEQCCLRAALAATGRSITLYEEVHSKKKEGCPKVHKTFLAQLAKMLPKGCKPVIVTDAGFKVPWFKSVEALGWDYIGRTRGEICYDEGEGYNKLKALYPRATSSPKPLGEISLTKAKGYKTNCYLYKHELKGRHKYQRDGKTAKDKDSLKRARGYKEPWILVSSLKRSKVAAKKIVKIYKIRMTIEESFRDTKSEKYGFSLRENRTIKVKRYIVWLMLSALASLIAWVVGYRAEQLGLHLKFQANTYKHRRVLSFFFLGCQVLRKKIKFPINLSAIPAEAWELSYE